jgi:excisionase family DNA binding protein
MAKTKESQFEARRARDGARKIRDLAGENGSPLTTHDLAEITGMSQTFIRAEIHSGQLRALALGRGKKRVFRIPFREAKRYVRRLGFL